jgi:RNA polymerase sigma-70 factor, ECF subfamily
MRRLATGDEDAFLEFFRRHQGSVFRYALHMTGRHDAAADVVQETFLTIIRRSSKYDEQKGAPAAFLFGIARNHLRKLREKESRFVPLGEQPGEGHSSDDGGPRFGENGNGHHSLRLPNPETLLDGLQRAELVELLHDAVLTLPDHYRDPVTLCDLEGKSYHEASQLLDCPVGTVRSRLNRARSILLEKLRPARVRGKGLGVRVGENP